MDDRAQRVPHAFGTHGYKVWLKNPYHQFLFLTGQYSILEICYFIKKRNENDKNTNFMMKTKK